MVALRNHKAMTWGEFVDFVRKAGVQNTDIIDYIDFSFPQLVDGEATILVSRNDYGEIVIH